MTVKVLLFAAAREIVGANEIQVPLKDGSRVADLRINLAESFPTMKELLLTSNWSVNQCYVTDDFELVDGCEVGLIVPVSGG